MRKMLKEEKEFRDWIYTTLGGPDKLVSRRIVALIHAVREDCISAYESRTYPQNRNPEIIKDMEGKK